MKSIRTKLIAFSLFLIMVTVIPIVITVNILINKSVQNKHTENVIQQVHSIEQMLEVFYADLDHNIDMFAIHPEIRAVDNTITSYKDTTGKTAMTPSQNGGIEQEIYEEFTNYAKSHPGTVYVYLGTNDGGYVQWPENDVHKGYDPRTKGWYGLGMGKNGTIARTNPYWDTMNGSLIVSNIRSFRGKDGQDYGVIGIDVSSHKLASMMKGVKIGRTGYAMMLHKQGVILADPRNEQNNRKQVKDVGIEKLETTLDAEKACFETKIDDISYQVASFQSPNTDWIIATFIETSELSEMSTSIRNTVLLITGIVFVLIGLLTYVISGRVVKPINLMVEGLKDIAQGEGDLTMRLVADSRDEIGDMARWFNTFVEKLQGIIASIAGDSDGLNNASSALLGIAGEVSRGADQMSEKSHSVAAAAEEMSSNLTSVAAAVEESSTNLGMVSAAAEEMTSTITEIAGNTEKTRLTSNDAVVRTKKAFEKMDELSQSAQQIGNVVETITDISEQTNLLALNATIEAARAGEAGKGFAVVAGEIKDLARQTAEATLEIKNKIQGIQASTRETVTEIEAVSGGIGSVSEMVHAVAAAVEEQSVTTKDIAANVSQAALGIRAVTENVTQSSGVASEIARDIADVSQTAAAMSESSTRIDGSAGKLSQLSGNLEETVKLFKV